MLGYMIRRITKDILGYRAPIVAHLGRIHHHHQGQLLQLIQRHGNGLQPILAVLGIEHDAAGPLLQHLPQSFHTAGFKHRLHAQKIAGDHPLPGQIPDQFQKLFVQIPGIAAGGIFHHRGINTQPVHFLHNLPGILIFLIHADPGIEIDILTHNTLPFRRSGLCECADPVSNTA